MAITRDQIATDVSLLYHSPDSQRRDRIEWYWKVIPTNESTTPMTPDPENSEQYLKNPDQYFEGVRGFAATRNEAQALVDANVANVLANGVAGITTL